MQFFTLLPIALAALVSAQDSSSSAAGSTVSMSYSNAATTLLTQTDSNGVITGQPTQPAAVTSQPALATSQDSVALVPAGFTSGTTTATYGNQTFTIAVNSGVTSLVRSTPTPTTQGTAGGSGASASGTASGTKSSSSAGAAAHIKVGAGALFAAGGFFAVFM